MATQGRYKLERVQGSAELNALQDRLVPLLDRLSSDTESTGTSITAAGAFTAVAADWADPPPTTLAEAVARLAAANPGA